MENEPSIGEIQTTIARLRAITESDFVLLTEDAWKEIIGEVRRFKNLEGEYYLEQMLNVQRKG